MRRILRILALLLALAAIVVGAEWTRERFTGRPSDLRTFNAAAVGQLDTDMWRSYYERRPVRLLEQMKAVTNAYRAAHGAFVFKDGRSRSDYQKALPDLEAYYRDIDAPPHSNWSGGSCIARILRDCLMR